VDSHDDPIISDAEDMFGDAAYSVFFKMLELYGREFDHKNLEGFMSFSKSFLKRKLRKSWTKVELILNFYSKKQIFIIKIDDKNILIKIPKFIEKADNWTQRLSVKQGKKLCSNSVVTTAIEEEVEVEQEVKQQQQKEKQKEILKKNKKKNKNCCCCSSETLLNKLLSLKIPQKKAEYLIKNYDNIENWLDALNLIKPKNNAGFLVKALEEKWELPEELRKKKAGKDRKKKEKLMSQYYESIFKQVDEHLCRMDKSLVQEELKQYKEIFLNKYPKYREFEKNTFLNPFIEQDYKKSKIEELGLLSFAQWEKQRL